MGAVMVVVALAMLGNYDIRFQNPIASRPAELPRQPDRRPRGHRLGPGGAGRHPRRLGARRSAPSGARGARREAERRSGQLRACRCSATAPEFVDNRALVQHPRRQAADAGGPARPRRPGRLLDLQLHQLHPHAALPERLGQALPQGRPDDRRRPHARVPVREARRATSKKRSTRTGSNTRSSRTTNRRPGTPTATSTGRPSTSSTPRATSATPTSARATTARKRR